MTTKDITGHRVIGPHKAWFFPGGTGVYIHQAEGMDPPSLDIEGFLTVQGRASDQATGIRTDTASELVTIRIHEGGMLNVWTPGGASTGVIAGCPLEFENDGLVRVGDNHETAIAINAWGPTAHIVNAGQMEVTVENGAAAAFSLAAVSTVLNSGTVTVQAESAYGLVASGAVQVTNTGSFDIQGVDGARAMRLSASGSHIDNQGNMEIVASRGADCIGISIAGGDSLQIDNSGAIHARFAIQVDDEAATAVTLVNSGDLRGVIQLGLGADRVDNTGLMFRNLFLRGGDDMLTMSGHGHVKGEVFGGAGMDTLDGGRFDDRMDGGKGADQLAGGGGADMLVGGSEADVFLYRAESDSTSDHADLIVDLDGMDQIALSGVDADVTADGDQAFVLVSALDGHAGQLALTYDAGADVTLLQGDVDGDGVADLVMQLHGNHADFTNFVL